MFPDALCMYHFGMFSLSGNVNTVCKLSFFPSFRECYCCDHASYHRVWKVHIRSADCGYMKLIVCSMTGSWTNVTERPSFKLSKLVLAGDVLVKHILPCR